MKTRSLVRFVFLFIIIVTISCSGCTNDSPVLFNETRLLMDTYCTITIHGDIEQGLLDEAFMLCTELEALFSITIEGSDVWRINHAGGEPVSIDPRTIELIGVGLEFGVLSEGMLDISIGRLSRLWDFGKRQGDGSSVLVSNPRPLDTLPLLLEIDNVKSTIDYTKITIINNTIQLENPDTWIDLGAIAKGYIADKVAEMLIERGVSGALIDLGGDVRTVGSRQDGNPWRIALRKPFGSMEDWVGIVEVSDVAVVSSGTYERQFEVDGVIYHHILDPFTGMPVKTDIVSATVIAKNALTGEGLSTIAILAGSDKASWFFERSDDFFGAFLVLDTGELLEFGDIQFVRT